MYLNVFVPLAALAFLINNPRPAAAAPTEAVTAVQGQATFVSSWSEGGLTRYRFNYTGVDRVNFLHAFQNCRGITVNWQSWSEDGHGMFDDSEGNGLIGALVISCGILSVIGQDCHAIGGIGCYTPCCNGTAPP